MKKLYSQLLVSLAALFLIVALCAGLSAFALQRVEEARALLRQTPTPGEFAAVCESEAGRARLLRLTAALCAQTKKAGSRLAFFLPRESLNLLDASLAAFDAAVNSREPAAYGSARAALDEALSNVWHQERFSLRTFF